MPLLLHHRDEIVFFDSEHNAIRIWSTVDLFRISIYSFF